MRALQYKLAVAAACLVAAPAWAAPPSAPHGQPDYTFGRAVHHDTSRPMREILAELEARGVSTTPPDSPFVPNIILDSGDLGKPVSTVGTPNVQRTRGTPAPSTIVSFNGLSTSGSIPPDTTGDVSPTHFFQWVNTRWSLFNKATGAVIQPATNGNSFFAGFGGLCQTTNQGDPLVLWDDAAQRWVVSQFAFTSTSAPPFLQCVAVSATSDPLGAYHRYSFSYPQFNDYGKMGIWRSADGSQNAYLFTMHEFGASFAGTSFSAVERDKMLAGQPAQFVRVGGIDAFGALPFHLEGTAPMPAGACPVFAHFSFAGDGYLTWDLCLNWAAGQIVGFNPEPTLLRGEPFVVGTNDIPQMGTATLLDSFDINSMYLAAARAFPATGPQEAVAAMAHAVNAGAGKAGQKWVQFGFRAGAGNPDILLQNGFEDAAPPRALAKRIVQEGTYSPDANHRWMSAINVDQNGNLGLGYNVSGATTNPVIRINGRDATDPPGTLREEQNCTPATTGAQTGGVFPPRTTGRWGDYATTGIDPTDDCTFWHTGEFFPVTSATSWSTRVCSFKFDSCGQPALVLEVTPTAQLAVCSTAPADPVIDVRVAALGGLTGNTNLSASAFPPGVTPSFNPAAVAPGGTSAVTLAGARLLAPGEYTGTVTGTNGAASDSETVRFGVSAVSAPAPVLTTPANNATGASIRPTLAWTAAPGATRYRIELSTSNTFATLLETGESTTTSYTTTTLLTVGQQYFWRVRSLNFCGEGALSTTFAFTTGQPGVCPSGTTANIVFQDDVAGDTILWTTQNISGDAAAHWSKRIPPAGVGLTTRGWYADNSQNSAADQRLISPAIVLPAAVQRPLTLAFDAHHRYETDGAVNCWDGGFVEISTDGGTNWTPLGNARTLTDPYPGTLSGSPAAGNLAWCRQPTPGTAIRTVFTLDGFDGQSVQLRFRSVSDDNTVGTEPNGWAIDNFVVQGCQ